MTLWDVSGQATRLWKHYFDKIDAVIFVVDSTDEKRFAKSRSLMHKTLRDADLQKVPVLIFANKQDMENAKSPNEINEELKLEQARVGRTGDMRF